MLQPLTPLSLQSCWASKERDRIRDDHTIQSNNPLPHRPYTNITLLTLESFSSLNRRASRPGEAETLTLRCALHLYSFSIVRGCGASARLTAHSAERRLWMWDYFSSYSYTVMQKAFYPVLSFQTAFRMKSDLFSFQVHKLS